MIDLQQRQVENGERVGELSAIRLAFKPVKNALWVAKCPIDLILEATVQTTVRSRTDERAIALIAWRSRSRLGRFARSSANQPGQAHELNDHPGKPNRTC